MLRENSTVHTFFCLNPNFQQSHTEPGRFIPIPHMTHDIQYLYLEKQRKGFEKKRFLTISEVNFQGKGRNHSQNDTKRKETKRVQEKSPFDNFQGQFSRRRKEKEPKQYRNIQKRNNMKRNEHGSRKRPWWQFPRTKDPFRSKGKKNESTKGRKNRNEKIMKKLNGDKRGMIIFNPKNDDQNEKHDFQSLAGWDEHNCIISNHWCQLHPDLFPPLRWCPKICQAIHHMCDGQNSIHVVRSWHRFTRPPIATHSPSTLFTN